MVSFKQKEWAMVTIVVFRHKDCVSLSLGLSL